jgi:hypothetical protein
MYLYAAVVQLLAGNRGESGLGFNEIIWTSPRSKKQQNSILRADNRIEFSNSLKYITIYKLRRTVQN